MFTKGELILGHNSVVGVNALVTGSFPPYSAIGGKPARMVQQYNPITKKWLPVSKPPVGDESAPHEHQVRQLHDAEDRKTE